MYKHILIATDGAPLSSHAIGKAMTLAKDMGAKVTVLTCTEPLRIFSLEPEQVARTINNYKEEASKQAHRILAAARQEAEMLGVPCETLEVEHGHPHEAIIATAAEKGCDLIAMASHGRRGVSAIVLGSETLKVLTHSKIPVLVYR